MANEILLNKEKIEEMSARFDGISAVYIEAAQYTEKAQNLQHDLNSCGEVVKAFSKKTDKIKKSIKLIIDSFTTVDQKAKEQAEQIIGVEVHNSISRGSTIVYDENGNVIRITPRLEGYRGFEQWNGECTCISTANLIVRYRLLHDSTYNNEYTSYQDIRSAVHGGGIWNVNMSENLPDGCTYSVSGEYRSINQAELINLLNAHDEGIVLYAPYGGPSESEGHAIVITRYEVQADGSVKYFAVDPQGALNSYPPDPVERELTDTYLYSAYGGYGSVDSLLANMYGYQYISYFSRI